MGMQSRSKRDRLRSDNLQLFLGRGSRGKLRLGISAIDQTDDALREIVADVTAKVRAKYPHGLPDGSARIDTYQETRVQVFTQRQGPTYMMSVWADEALSELIKEKGVESDIIFNKEYLTQEFVTKTKGVA